MRDNAPHLYSLHITMNNTSEFKNTVRIISWMCGFIFTIFSLAYLYYLQADLLAMAQHILSGGRTTYSPVWGAVLLTTALLLLRAAFGKTIAYPLRFNALYFFPSFLLIGLLTSIRPNANMQISLGINWIAIVIYLALFSLISWIALHFPDRKNVKQNIFAFAWTNILLLSLQAVMTAAIANTHDVYHYRLQTEHYLIEGNDTAALHVGETSLQADRCLTSMRAFALSRTGQLGNKLFEYPQYYGSKGLLPHPADTLFSFSFPQMLFQHLKAKPAPSLTNTTRFLTIIAQKPNASVSTPDYLLCALLLDKNLDTFVTTIPKYYPLNAHLPLYYKQALTLYAHLHPADSTIYYDKKEQAVLNEFINAAAAYTDPVEQANTLRKNYDKTYYWYYFCQKLQE